MYNTENFLKDIDNAKEHQYLMLREAIWKRMEAQRNISVFTVTAILAFYTIVFSINVIQPYIFLVPLIIILPFSYKELHHKISISYIAAYQIVCLENNKNVANSFTWETDHFLFKKKRFDRDPHILFNKIVDSEFLILSVISYALYVIYFFAFSFDINDFWCPKNLVGYICAIVFIFLLIIIGQITKEYNLYVNSVGYYVKKWLKFMLDEGRIDADTYKERFMELIGDESQDSLMPWK